MTSSEALGSRPADDPRWRDDARCRSADVALFFPSGETGIELDNIRAAKALCRACPVMDGCLQYAIETRQTDGIWGGTTKAERRKLRRAWLASRPRRAADPEQVAPAISSAPEPEVDRPVEGRPPRRLVPRPPWAGAEPPVRRKAEHHQPYVDAQESRTS